MPAVGDALADDPGRERADFVLGDRDGTTCEPAFTALVAATVRGWAIPSRSTIRTRASSSCAGTGVPPSGRHSLQIEIKRTLYMDEVTLVPNAGYERLRTGDLAESLVATLAALRAASDPHRRGRGIGLTT